MRKRNYFRKNFQSNPQELDIKATLFFEIFCGSRPRSGHVETIWRLIRFDTIIYCPIYNVQAFKIMSLMPHNIINRVGSINEMNRIYFNNIVTENLFLTAILCDFFFFCFPISNLLLWKKPSGMGKHAPPTKMSMERY